MKKLKFSIIRKLKKTLETDQKRIKKFLYVNSRNGLKTAQTF